MVMFGISLPNGGGGDNLSLHEFARIRGTDSSGDYAVDSGDALPALSATRNSPSGGERKLGAEHTGAQTSRSWC